MTTARPHLRVVPASGEPVERVVGYSPDGSDIVRARQHTPCPGCDVRAAAGADITYYRSSWWHLTCAREHLATRPASAAWIALAEQLVRRPSHFKASEVKTITSALLDIVQPGYALDRRSS